MTDRILDSEKTDFADTLLNYKHRNFLIDIEI